MAVNNASFSKNGIYLDSSSNNMIYHNNIIKNTNQAFDNLGPNTWDNGYPSGGNYWSDYIEVDIKSGPNQDQSGSDGIGDTPYPIPDGSSVDNYPHMDPWDKETINGHVHNINKGTYYTTIQAAIDDASPGNEIHVDSGTYYENVIVNKQLTLRGVDTGDGMPMVDAGGSSSAINLNADGIILEGFKTVNSGNNWYSDAGIKVTSNNNRITANIAIENVVGIRLYSSNDNILIDNDASYNSDLTTVNSFGIFLTSSNNNTLIGNTASNNIASGIYLTSSINNSLYRNTVNNNYGGISFYQSNNNTINENIANNNSQDGIYISDSMYNTLTCNIARNNSIRGIYLLGSTNNILTGNTANNNSIFGIALHLSSYNILSHNNLVDNINNNAFDTTENNQWDNGTEGNYYSDYTGTDSDGDGIGDTPYPILSGSSVDNYPLMNPWGSTPSAGLVHNINKGTDYTTIQAAIDDASPGDEIHVDSGTYYENVVVNKQLTLRGFDTGAGMPVIDAGGNGNVITLSIDGCLLDGFIITNSGLLEENAGIEITSNNNVIKNNEVFSNKWGIDLVSSNNNILKNNIVTFNSYPGIVLTSSNNNIISNNAANSNGYYGIELYLSSNNTVIDNIANSNTRYGIFVWKSDNDNKIIFNTANNNEYAGIRFHTSNNNEVSGNILELNIKYGISMYGSSGNIIFENNASFNENGIYLDSLSNNIIYHNNINKNTYQAFDNLGPNNWDNGYPSGGNYWSDYTGTDSDSDGIGDTPYPIPGGSSVDRYPLMAPYSPPSGFTVGQGAPTPEIEQLFIDAYNRNGGLEVMGKPDSDVHEAFGLYQVQNFPGVPGIHGGVIMYNPIKNNASYIHGAIWERYYIFPDKTKLGPVASDEQDAAVSPKGTIGRYTKFETGTIHWISDQNSENLGHPQRGKSFVTYEELDDIYTKMDGTYSHLGFPIMDQEERDGHGYCEFEGGSIVWDTIEGKYNAYTIKSKLFIEDAPPGIVVNKAPGDITDVVLEIENTGDTTQIVEVELDYPPSLGTPPTIYSRNDYFDILQADLDLMNIEIGPHSKKQIIWRFELPSSTVPERVNVNGKIFSSYILISENSGTFDVIKSSSGIIITNRKLLFEKFGSTESKKEDTILLLNTLYIISDGSNNKKEISNVVYYVDRYDTDIANWTQKVNYQDENLINIVANKIDAIVESKQKILQSNYLTIVGGDEIIPFYRMIIPGMTEEADSAKNLNEDQKKDLIHQMLLDNYFPTDINYANINSEPWYKKSDIPTGRISSSSSKDMNDFIKNSIEGPSDENEIAILVTDTSIYSTKLVKENLEQKLSVKELKFWDTEIFIKDGSILDTETRLLVSEQTKLWMFDEFKLLSYAGHSGFNNFAYIQMSDFPSISLSKNRPLISIGGCKSGLTTNNGSYWDPQPDDNVVWQLSNRGASTILASGSLSSSSGIMPGLAYTEQVYNKFYDNLFIESKDTAPVGKALQNAINNYDEGLLPAEGLDGMDIKARMQFILYGLPWMTFDPPINPTEPIDKDYIVSFSNPEKMDNNSFKVSATIDVTDYNLTSIDDFNLITINGTTNNLKDFKPILPVININLNLPVDSEINQISINSENGIDLGNLNIPSFQSTITNDLPKPSFTNISDINGVFPPSRFITTNITNQGYKNVKINVAPVQYNIDTHETVLFNKTVLEIIYKSNDSIIITDFLSLHNRFNINDIISTNVTIENIGSEPVENIHYEFTISDLFGNKVKSHNSSEFNISMGVYQYEANVSTQYLQQGSYLAKINILNNTGYILTTSSEYIYLISGEMTNFTINSTRIEQIGELELRFDFENFNISDITAHGQISISDSENNVIDQLQIPETIVPGNNTGQFSYIWHSRNNNPGLYKAELTLLSENADYGPEDQWFTIKNSYNLSFLPPLSQGFYNLESGSILPIRFTARDYDTGEFIYDNSVNVSILNITGNILVSFNSTNGVQIDSDNEQYNIDLSTVNYPDLRIGRTYTVRVNFGTEDSNKSSMDSYFSLVDLTPPSPITNPYSTTGTTWINFTWTNPSEPDFNHTELYLNGTFLTNIPASQNYYNITGLLPDTSYELSTRTVDTSGNINETWVNATARTLSVSDDTPPTITFISPTNPSGTTLTTRNWTFINVSLSEPGLSWLEWNGINESMAGSGTNWYINKTDLVNGVYSYRVWANDTAENENVSETRTIEVDYITDDFSPIITITSPINDTLYTTDSVDLNYTINEPTEWEGYSLDGADNITLSGNTTLFGLNDGEHILTVYANDTSGNMNSSTVWFTIDTTPPEGISDLQHTAGQTWINWTWTNPPDPDFNHTEIYLNGTFQTNTSAEFFNATDLTPGTEYAISTRTVDINGNINLTWVNDTATTTDLYNITFLPPITTMDQFNLTNGRTLPIKFTSQDNDTGDFIYDDTVNVTIKNSTGHLITYFTHGKGTDSVRINSEEEQYIVNFHSKNYDLNVGETYVVTVTFGEQDNLGGYEITYFTLVDKGKGKEK